MTVFIAHAEVDRAPAEALEKYLERRGVFAEIEDGVRAFRVAQGADLIVVLWSKGATAAPRRLALERRTFEAWADDRLILVKLDRAFAPAGLRDLPAIDASVEAQRDIAWAAVNKRALDERPAPPAPAPTAPAARASGKVALMATMGGLAAVALAALTVALVGVRPGWLLALPPGAYQIALPFLGALSAMLLMGLVALAVRRGGASKAGPPGDHVFLSYAREDGAAALPFVEALQSHGRTAWLPDKANSPAREAVMQAMETARSAVVLCSAHAFDSDRVKREVFLADRLGKPRLAVMLEAVAAPADFTQFLAGAQTLELAAVPQADRAAAIARALKGL